VKDQVSRVTRLVLAIPLLAAGAAVSQPTATGIITKADQLTRGLTQHGTESMTVVRPDWQREMVFEFWSEGADKAFIEILEPARHKGATFLKIGREMWQYVPRINRVIKIPPSMMMQSWMGSDFTNDDLVKESSIVHDYEHELLRTDTLRGDSTWVLQLTAKPDAPVTWTRLVEWIRVGDYVPMRAEYYSERGELIRTLIFEDIREFGDRSIPARMVLEEKKKPGHQTILQIRDVTFNEKIPPGTFTQQNLRRN